MSNIKTLKKRNKIDSVLEEIGLLKSVIIGWIGKDKEGDYNPEFIDNVINSSKDKQVFKFADKRSFLNQLKK